MDLWHFHRKKFGFQLLIFCLILSAKNTIGLIAIHAGSGPSVGFGAAGYKTSNKWCYPESICKNREIAKEIIILEKYEQ